MNNIKVIDTFSQFVTASADHSFGADGWRAGQRAMNLLAMVRPELREMLLDSDMDPFYDDGNLPDFYDFLVRHWDI